MTEEFPDPVKIADFLSADRVVLADVQNKQEVLELLAQVISTGPNMPPRDHVLSSILRREEILSTGIGQGLAVPHVRMEGISDLTLAVALLKNPIPYGSFDEQPARLVVMVLAPPGTHRYYLRILSQIVKMVKNEKLREKIYACRTPEQVHQCFCS